MRLADSFRVGQWSVHPRLNHIDDGHETRHLEPKVMDVLCHLARHVDEVLTREDLLEAVWPGITVGDDALTRAVAELRRALGDDARSPAYVETIPKRGYRLRAVVTFPESEAAPPRSTALLFVVALAGAGIALVAGLSAVWKAAPGAAALPATRPLTTYPGAEREPSLSPGGDRVAFTWVGEAGTVRNLYVRMVDGGNPVLVSSGPGDVHTPAWSPDGRKIAFLREGEGDGDQPSCGVFEVSALGGDERRLTTVSGGRGLSWSPDGGFLALSDRDAAYGPPAIYLFSFENGQKRRLTSPPPESRGGDRNPRFSPDGTALAFQRGGASEGEIYVASLDDGKERRLTFGNPNTQGLDWTSDGRHIVFSSARPGRAGLWSLWVVSSSGGEPQPLEVGEQAQYPTLSRRGGRLAYVRTSTDFDIWRAPLASPGAPGGAPAPFIVSTGLDYYPEYSPDGKYVCFTSSRSGHLEIWIADSDGKNPRQLTFLQHWLTINGSWSPDGQRIAFMSSKEGSLDVYVVEAAGGLPRRHTPWPSDDGAAAWSRDGRFLYFGSNRSGTYEVWKVPISGGDPVRVTRNGGTQVFESARGDYLYFGKQIPAGGPPGIWRVPVGGGDEELVRGDIGYGDWTLLEDGICYLNRETKPWPTFERLAFDTGGVERVASLEHEPLAFWPSASPDGRWLLYSVDDGRGSDIMLVDDFR